MTKISEKDDQEANWNKKAANILKSEIVRKGLTHEDLAKKLNDIGIAETPNTIRLKLYRGTFRFAFFLQCAEVLGLEKIQIN